MRIWLPFTTLAFYVYDIVFSRFSYDCKRPYKTMWSVFRTKPNNVVHTQIVFRASFSFLTEISPLLSVWFSFRLLPYFQPFFLFSSRTKFFHFEPFFQNVYSISDGYSRKNCIIVVSIRKSRVCAVVEIDSDQLKQNQLLHYDI